MMQCLLCSCRSPPWEQTLSPLPRCQFFAQVSYDQLTYRCYLRLETFGEWVEPVREYNLSISSTSIVIYASMDSASGSSLLHVDILAGTDTFKEC